MHVSMLRIHVHLVIFLIDSYLVYLNRYKSYNTKSLLLQNLCNGSYLIDTITYINNVSRPFLIRCKNIIKMGNHSSWTCICVLLSLICK